MLLLLPMAVRAYDFAAAVPSGQTLYFSYASGGVKVVYPNSTIQVAQGWDGYTKPTGALTVPATVSHGGTAYSVVSVDRYAFHSCSGLTSVTLAEGIDSVGPGAFYSCTGITGLSLPSTLVSIGNGAFSGFAALADVWTFAQQPPSTSSSAFYNTALGGCLLHLPCGAAASYAADAVWSTFGSVDEMGCTVTVGAQPNHNGRGTVVGAGTYTVGTLVTLVAQPAAGYCFVCWSDGDTLNPRIVSAMGNCSYTAMFFVLPHDTVYLADGDTVTLHDTVTLTDTVYYAVVQHDTLLLTDTVYYSVVVHDTVCRYDTVYHTDTVHDTVVPTYFTLSVTSAEAPLGVGVGSAVLPAGTVAEVCGLPLEGGRFVTWDDGNTDNPRQVTVTGNLTLRAMFEQVGVKAVEAEAWTAVADGRRLTVNCRAGEPLRLYDVQGRCLLSQTARSGHTVLLLPSAGVYLVQVGGGAARRIVVD